MADRGYDLLAGRQKRIYEQVMRGIERQGVPASTLLLAEDATAEDRAAVAELLSPGAGKGYR